MVYNLYIKMEKKTKILLAITKSNWGGAQRYVFDIATSLPNNLFDIVVVTGGSGELVHKLTNKNIPTILIPEMEREVNPIKDIVVAKKFRQIIKTEKPDIIHLNSSKMAVYGFLATIFRRQVKTVFTSHGWPFNEKRSILSRIFFKSSLWLALKFIDKVIFVSQNTAEQAFKMKIVKPSQAEVIHNGIHQIDFLDKETARNKIMSITQTDQSGTWFGTIAELHKNKGLMSAIEAFDLLGRKDLKYFIIGAGELREKLVKEIQDRNLSNQVFLLGKIDNASTLLKAFDYFILPSLTESLPYVLIEAGQAGLPTIATNVGGVSEIIDSDIDGLLVRPGRPKELVQVICKMLKIRKNTFGAKIQEKTSKKFDFQQMVDRTISVYNHLLVKNINR